VKFFFDNNLAPKLAHGLNEMFGPEHRFVHLKDKFPPDVEDAGWMSALGQEADWLIVTADVRIGRNPYEVQAWKESGHTVFFLKPGWVNLPFCEQASKFIKYFPALVKEAERAERGSAFTIAVNGKIQKVT